MTTIGRIGGTAATGVVLFAGSAAIAQAAPVIDRVDITTWAYNRVEGDTYTADNANGKALTVYWKSFAGGERVRSGCTSTVEVTGAASFSEIKHVSGCEAYNPGASIDLRSPGEYTAKVTVHQAGRTGVTAERTITILPH